MAPPPSGEQFEIRFGEHRATVVEVGGGVREYLVGDRPVLDPYPRDAICDGAHGAPLIPWPNRLADGRYSFDGVEHQLALTEPAASRVQSSSRPSPGDRYECCPEPNGQAVRPRFRARVSTVRPSSPTVYEIDSSSGNGQPVIGCSRIPITTRSAERSIAAQLRHRSSP